MSDSTLESQPMTVLVSKKAIEPIARSISDYYEQENGKHYPVPVVIRAISEWLEERLKDVTEDMEELLTSPQRPEAREFRRHLEGSMRDSGAPTETRQEKNVFTGNRAFSMEKLAAMMAYIAGKGKEVYKTKLNKLLFYSDFINYYLYGRSISGARYVHLPFGPVPDRYERILQGLAAVGTIHIDHGPSYEVIRAGREPIVEKLSSEEIETLDWVLANYGHLSANQISELSHREKAYRFTRTGEEIAYEYAKLFEKLPRRTDN